MPFRRMLHAKISDSLSVNDLPVPARLLFTWMIAHADDDGRLKGEPRYIKYTVVPQTTWSAKLIEKYLHLMVEKQLIYYWEDEGEKFIEFKNWGFHQYIPKDRYHQSSLPGYHQTQSINKYVAKAQSVYNSSPESNRNKLIESQINKGEYKVAPPDKELLTLQRLVNSKVVPPDGVMLVNEREAAAVDIFNHLEPDNPKAFHSTYLAAAHKNVPADLMYQWFSEIKQSRSVKNPGKVFNAKLKEYLKDSQK